MPYQDIKVIFSLNTTKTHIIIAFPSLILFVQEAYCEVFEKCSYVNASNGKVCFVRYKKDITAYYLSWFDFYLTCNITMHDAKESQFVASTDDKDVGS